MRQPCWSHSGARGDTAAEDKGRGYGFAQGHADTGMSRARHERHCRVPGDSGHKKENGSHHWVHNDESNTTKQESLKNSKLRKVKFSENQKCARYSTK